MSYVCETRQFVMAILHWEQGLLCDKSLSYFKVSEVNKLKMGKITNFASERVENFVGKVEWLSAFSPFPTMLYKYPSHNPFIFPPMTNFRA